jgi:hypothetical protein
LIEVEKVSRLPQPMPRWLIEIPASVMDVAVFAYCVLLAALSLVALTTAALWALLWALDFVCHSGRAERIPCWLAKFSTSAP